MDPVLRVRILIILPDLTIDFLKQKLFVKKCTYLLTNIQEMRNCFEVQFKQRDGKNKGSPMVAVSDQPEIFQLMKCAFEVSTARPR